MWFQDGVCERIGNGVPPPITLLRGSHGPGPRSRCLVCSTVGIGKYAFERRCEELASSLHRANQRQQGGGCGYAAQLRLELLPLGVEPRPAFTLACGLARVRYDVEAIYTKLNEYVLPPTSEEATLLGLRTQACFCTGSWSCSGVLRRRGALRAAG